MTDSVYEPVSDDENDGEVIDLDQVLGDDEVDDALDTSYSPPERPRGLNAFGTTAAEERQGESLDQRLAQEEPDPAMDVDLVEGDPALRASESEDVANDLGSGSGEEPDGTFSDGFLDDGEVGDARAGRLVAPDQGIGEDEEKDLVAGDVGIDAGAASAEEAAMHVVDSR
jgi:hypothetical protein